MISQQIREALAAYVEMQGRANVIKEAWQLVLVFVTGWPVAAAMILLASQQ